MTKDLKGLQRMKVIAGQMLEVLPNHINDAEDEDVEYHLSEAEGNLSQFVEELSKAIYAMKGAKE